MKGSTFIKVHKSVNKLLRYRRSPFIQGVSEEVYDPPAVTGYNSKSPCYLQQGLFYAPLLNLRHLARERAPPL